MPDTSNEFQVFVKPVGSNCNLECQYCYYLQKDKALYPGKELEMRDDILEKYIIQHIEASTARVINFSWHGGEPLLAGLDFYKRAVHFQKKYCPADYRIINGIQTNGTLINEQWCEFFARERFVIGISIDGPRELHNQYRINKEGKPSFDIVIRGYRLLQKYDVNSEILCVVNSANVQNPLEVYDFFRELNAKYISFLPLVKISAFKDEKTSPESVQAAAFGFFLGKIFDRWKTEGIGQVKVQIFEEAARTAFGQDHTLCIFKETCGGVPVVEFNGDYYSCDHYVDNEHLVGNIVEEPLVSLLKNDRQKQFGMAKLITLPKYCLECEVRDMCNGGCPKNRFITTPEGDKGLNYLCEAYKYFFNHCRPFVDAVAKVWQQQSSDY